MHRKSAAAAFRHADDALHEPPAVFRGDFIDAAPGRRALSHRLARPRGAFPEFGQTRVGIPGEPVTVSVSLELDTKDKVDEIFDKAIGLDLFGHRWIPNAPLG